MKPVFSSLIVLSFAIAGCNQASTKKEAVTGSGPANETTQNTVAETTNAAPDSATMMKNWMDYMTPSDMHKMMASWDGTWNGESTVWERPGAEPMKSKVSSVNRMILGGRYQESINTGLMMGTPFEGHGLMGYDNAKKLFISTWADNVGTGIMKMEGSWDPATKSITMKGTTVDPSAGNGKEHPFREILTIVNDNTQRMEMYGNGPDGKEFKMMEINLVRK